MAQESMGRSISLYPFGMSDTRTVSYTDIATSGGTAIATTAGNSVNRTVARSITGTLVFNQNAVYYLVLDCISIDNRKIQLSEPIAASISYQDSVYFCQNDDLGIFSMSDTLKGCLEDFQEEVLFIWKSYGKEDDNKLTNDAKQLKRKILQYIGK